ncbi:MAG: RMD1 family protein [Sulfurimonadaceae bacterium]|nr:RMD1 family protein [Sulfurimonadaceae bacterium]
MKEEMNLVSLYLPKALSRDAIENALGVTLKKRIEATYYAETDDALLIYTQFNVLTVINWPRTKIVEILEALGIEEAEDYSKWALYQDYPVHIDTGLQRHFTIDNDSITLNAFVPINLIIIGHVISQSVALELYEQKLTDYTERSRSLIDGADTYSIFKRNRLSRFAKELVLIRHDMMIDLHLLDKPNILWDDEEAELLYNRLASVLEIKDRFDVVEYKLNSIKDDIVMVMDLTNHNHSSFLEWIIIVLIGVEIVMGLTEWFAEALF